MADYNRVLGCWLKGTNLTPAQPLIYVTGDNYNLIKGCVIWNNKHDGIQLNTSNNTILVGNIIYGTNTAGARGIVVKNLADYNIITGNVILDFVSSKGVETEAGSTKSLVHGNSIEDNVTSNGTGDLFADNVIT